MNKFELICFYCGYSWEINYEPREKIYCIKCRDTNIKTVDICIEKVDYYAVSQPFREK